MLGSSAGFSSPINQTSTACSSSGSPLCSGDVRGLGTPHTGPRRYALGDHRPEGQADRCPQGWHLDRWWPRGSSGSLHWLSLGSRAVFWSLLERRGAVGAGSHSEQAPGPGGDSAGQSPGPAPALGSFCLPVTRANCSAAFVEQGGGLCQLVSARGHEPSLGA